MLHSPRRVRANARPDKQQFRKALRDRPPLKFTIGREYPDGLGDAKVGENQKAFPVGGPLKQAGRFRRELVVIGEERITSGSLNFRAPYRGAIRERPCWSFRSGSVCA